MGSHPPDLHLQGIQATASSTPGGWSPTGTASMFSQSVNPQIQNCVFNIGNTNNDISIALNILYQNVAPNAILNAGGRADEVRCHPGTREEAMALIDKWRTDCQDPANAGRIFWLSGPAGAGKTAIVQTVAENWKALDIPTANFFFFRTDPSRSHARSLVSTLLYQIFDFYPAARAIVEKTLASKPRILEASIAEQFEQLICAPFRSIGPPFLQPIVLLIDGLDECDSVEKSPQRHVLQALDKLVQQKDLPFSVLVASRQEPHISMAFKGLTSQVSPVFLNDQYSPAKDIETFVRAEFEKIKTLHAHAALLDGDWPPESDIAEIVRKSSGQFAYAATVMRFLACSSAVPSVSLEMVQGIVPLAINSPFAYLDSFYTYILGQADDSEAIRDILSAKLLDDRISLPRASKLPMNGFTRGLPPIFELLQLYNSRYTPMQIRSHISAISSLIQLQDNKLVPVVFYHASLADFLLDSSRSTIYHVDLDRFTAKLFPLFWKQGVKAISQEHQLMSECRNYNEPLGFILLHLIQETAPAITDALLSVHPSNFHSFIDQDTYCWVIPFLEDICRLYESQDKKSYRKIIKAWITWAVLVDEPDLRIFENLSAYPDMVSLLTPRIRRHLLMARIWKWVRSGGKVRHS